MKQATSKHEHETANGLMTRVDLLNALNHEAHVCLAFPDRHSDPKLLAWYRDLLSEEEREKHKRFYFARDRDLFLLTHALVRVTLSRYWDIAPDKWVFTHSCHGRPEIGPSEGNPYLRFSVSRTHGLVACLIALSIDAGVDVEKIRKLDNLKTLSENVLTDFEISGLRALPESDLIQGFFAFWTLKEAYIKARGEGLSLPLNRFNFYVDAARRLCVRVDSDLQDIPSNWQFASFRLTRSHAIAAALRRKDRADLRIRFFEAIPGPNELLFLTLKQYALENLNGFLPK